MPSIPEGPWRSKLLWAAHELPMPLVRVLIISGCCHEVFLAKVLISKFLSHELTYDFVN
ncbi:hypothetical protein A2U01_0029610 [Trifolium medium]|uniref:Uncharacterized protein n=1 Tax=Trifolium medium TaxID=97028 RepID=A0A392P8X2_9FABA|nr:hypothetical protein [Trifolium medium]